MSNGSLRGYYPPLQTRIQAKAMALAVPKRPAALGTAGLLPSNLPGREGRVKGKFDAGLLTWLVQKK